MFLVLDNETGEHDFSLKPMNCPSHHLYFASRKHSYRELPLRFSTQDVLHRNEVSGSLSGLTRVRQFAQDDAHIYCTEAQLADEVKRFIQLLDQVYAAFGLTYVAKFGTRPPVRIGDDALWDRAEASLESAVKSLGIEYEQNPGDGAFYGPKLDFHVKDSIGRTWQLGTIQADYNAPERFELAYVGEDNAEHRPVVLHRAIYGSFERFIAILVEHYAGAFPTWIAPVQVQLVTVADRQLALRPRGAGPVARPRLPRRAGRPRNDDEREDPRGPAPEDPVHPGDGRPGGGAARGGAATLRGRGPQEHAARCVPRAAVEGRCGAIARRGVTPRPSSRSAPARRPRPRTRAP